MTIDQGDGGPRPDGDPDHGESKRSAATGTSGTAGGSGSAPSDRRPSAQGSELLSEFQRWLIRSGARSMRREITGQVRRTFGGGASKPSDVWGTATTEIPPEEGEAPECQWCPICRAARRMRESGPGIGEHLSSAGDTVAAAMQEGLRALDYMLSGSGSSARPSEAEPAGSVADADGWAAARDRWAAEHGARIPAPGRTPPGGPAAATDSPGAADSTSAGDAAAAAQDVTSEPDGTDEPDDRS